jgi:flagellin-like protein
MVSKNIVRPKGISPMIATVLLIAFTVAVGGIVSIWITGFTSTTTEEVSKQSDVEVTCSYGGISVYSLSYCSNYLSGIVKNTNMIDIGNITVQVIFDNASTKKVYLCQNGSACVVSSTMSLPPGELSSFNVSIGGSNYDKIHVYTNCSNVYDDTTSAYVTAC